MEIKDKRFVTELKVVRNILREVDCENMKFDEHIKIVKSETSLDVLISLIEGDLVL